MWRNCESCGKKFNYKDLFKSQFFFKLQCSKCKQVYILKPYSRLIVAILTALPLFFINKLILTLGTYSLLVYICWYLMILIIMPFFYRFKKVTENNS